jgi:hypothetical protein
MRPAPRAGPSHRRRPPTNRPPPAGAAPDRGRRGPGAGRRLRAGAAGARVSAAPAPPAAGSGQLDGQRHGLRTSSSRACASGRRPGRPPSPRGCAGAARTARPRCAMVARICSRCGPRSSAWRRCTAPGGSWLKRSATRRAWFTTSPAGSTALAMPQSTACSAGEGVAQQQLLGRLGMAHQLRHQQAGRELGHQAQADEGHRQPRLVGHVDQVAVQQHRGADADGRAGDGRHHRLVALDQRAHELATDDSSLSLPPCRAGAT